MSRRNSKAEVLVVQLASRDEQPLRPLGKDRRHAIVESAGLPLLSLDEALEWAGKIRRPIGAWAVIRRIRMGGDES